MQPYREYFHTVQNIEDICVLTATRMYECTWLPALYCRGIPATAVAAPNSQLKQNLKCKAAARATVEVTVEPPPHLPKHTHTCTHIQIRICVCVHVRVYVCMYVCVCMCVWGGGA